MTNVALQMLDYNGIKVDTDKITPAGIAYLLQYGWAKSLQDSAAGRKKAMLAGDDETPPMTEEEAEAALVEIMTKRADAIVAGEVGQRAGGPRLTKLDRVMRNVAAEIIKTAAAKKGKKLPKGDAWQMLVSAYIEKNLDSVKAEAERRMESVSEEADDILDGLDI